MQSTDKNNPPRLTAPHLRLQGRGCFTDDVMPQDCLHVAFARSPVAAGAIVDMDLDDARALGGVVAVHDGDDLAGLGTLSVNQVLPLDTLPPYPVLAQGTVNAVGHPIAAVIATNLPTAIDAAELIWATIDEPDNLPAPKVIAQKHYTNGDARAAFDKADHVVSCEMNHPRLAPSPLEPRCITVQYDTGKDDVTIWHSTQTPHRTRSELATILGVSPDRIRVIAPDVGGAFGMKASLYPEEVFTVWAAFTHKRSVKWTATRAEDFLSATHGRGITTKGTLALAGDGTFLGLSADINAPLGGWLPNSALIPAWNAARILPSAYHLRDIDLATCASIHPRAPTGIYRGAGRPEANALMERLVDKAAIATGLDPIEIRKRNLIPAHQLPYETATGETLDSGQYAAALDLLAAGADYDALRGAQTRRRAAGELVGLGLAFYLEPSGNGWESARVTWNADDTVDVFSGSSAQGQDRATGYAKIVSDTLCVPSDQVRVHIGDTALCPPGIGALASRSTAIGGSAVLEACKDLKADKTHSPKTAEVRYETKGQAWGYGAYLVGVSIDPDTGILAVEHAHCIDDAGTIIDARAVHAQILGGFAQGIGAAMMEVVQYDDAGQLLTGSLMDYALPRAVDMPPLWQSCLQTPSPMNTLGAKGVGEAGTIGAPIAILNAAIDALSPLGITDLDLPLTPHTLWQVMRAATKEQSQ